MPHSDHVEDWMTREPCTTGEDTSLFGAYDLMQRRNVRRLPVLSASGALAGIVTRSDILMAAPFAPDQRADAMFALAGLTVADCMTRHPLTVAPTDTIAAVAGCMLAHHISGVPVVEDAALVGIITESDIFRLVVQDWPAASSCASVQEPHTP